MNYKFSILGPTKNWIALEDSLQRCNEPNAITALIATSALKAPPINIEERNVFAIYVSYYVKVKLTLSGMGGELSLKLPFTLAHIDKINPNDDNASSLIIDQLKPINISDDKPQYNPLSPTSTTATSSSTPLTSMASTTATAAATTDDYQTLKTGGTTGRFNLCSASSGSGRDNNGSSGSPVATTSGIGSSRCGASFNHKQVLSSTLSSSSTHSYQFHTAGALKTSTTTTLAQQHNQQFSTLVTSPNTTELIDKIEQISDDLVIERGNGSGKSIVMLKHTRRASTIQISSVDDDPDDATVVGQMASDLLNGSDLDVRQTETTCVEVHATST